MIIAGLLYILFALLIVAVKFVDVAPIGPQSSEIGLATLNGAVADLVGVNMAWYRITDALGIVAIALAGGFALLGLVQFIRRRSLLKVDADIIILGIFYAAVVAVYAIFEVCIVNYRPIIMHTELEASFPSSHTMLVVCIMLTAVYQLNNRINHKIIRIAAVTACSVIAAVTVVGRMLSGVHWFTDIIGGLIISGALILTYIGLCKTNPHRRHRR